MGHPNTPRNRHTHMNRTLVLNGSSTAEDVNLTILVDAADIDDGVTTEILASGFVVVRWMYAGDL